MSEERAAIVKEMALVALGCAIYALSLDAISIPNRLADGGLSGITLIMRFYWHIDPGLSTLVLNIPLIILGWRYMSRRMLLYTIWGTACLSFFLWLWRHLSIIIQFNFEHDLFISGMMAGLLSGLGLGIVFRYYGTTGGTDIIARVMQIKFGIASGRTILAFDVVVLVASLTYLDLRHMMYTVLGSFVMSRTMDTVQAGAYVARGLFIISDHYEEIAKMIDLKLERGFTYIKAEGGYGQSEKRIIYCIVSPREIHEVKQLILNEDPNAFVSVFDVKEALGEGFSYKRKTRHLFIRK